MCFWPKLDFCSRSNNFAHDVRKRFYPSSRKWLEKEGVQAEHISAQMARLRVADESKYPDAVDYSREVRERQPEMVVCLWR